MNRVPSSELPLNQQVYQIFTDSRCLMCHSYDAELPIYAKIPLVRRPIYQDMDKATKEENLTAMMDSLAKGASIPLSVLNKLELVAKEGSMPPARFYLIHWGTSLTDEKRDIILRWVKQQRLEGYLSQLQDTVLANRLASEPVYPILYNIPVDSQKVALGFKLYHDTRLSADNTVSCASCHPLATGGMDNLQYSDGVNGAKGGVNAPTVYNSVFNFVHFWDGRAATLAAQAAGPPLNPVEMASASFDEIISKLNADKEFTKEFLAVYPGGYSEANITDAIQEFEKTLTTPDCPFDLYLKGDDNALTAQQKAGYESFKKYECATCHGGVNFGGNSYELMGIRNNYFGDRQLKMTEEDFGRFKQTRNEYDRHRFKVPSLRNIALTSPYFHDGTISSLKTAILYMGQYQLGMSIPEKDLMDMEAFMGTLNGKIPATANVQ